MAITPPGPEQLGQIAARYGLTLSPADLESFGGLVTGALASYDEVERLYLASRPEPPGRDWQWPAADGTATSWAPGT